MNQTYASVESLSEKIVSITDQVGALSISAEAVDEIVSVIGAISQQSGLLAINASIEAAKARDVGKGFGIIAKEMKLLSGQSRQSAMIAQEKLRGIQQAVKETRMRVMEGSEIFFRLKDTAVSAKEAIELVATAIGKIDQFAQQIANVSAEQVVSIEQVVSGVNELKTASLQLADGNAKLVGVFVSLEDTAVQLRAISFA